MFTFAEVTKIIHVCQSAFQESTDMCFADCCKFETAIWIFLNDHQNELKFLVPKGTRQ
jgi:hypothetical protein